MAVRRSCCLWKSNREKSIRARRSQASISLLVSYSNFVSSISLYLSLFSPSPISFRYSFVLRITVSASEDSNVSYIYLYPFSTSSSYSYTYTILLHFAIFSVFPRCDTSIYLSISPCLVMSVYSPFLYFSIHPFVTFFSLPRSSQPVSASQTVDTRCYRTILKHHFLRTPSYFDS